MSEDSRIIGTRHIALRSGGIGDVVVPGVKRKTARHGSRPIDVPYGRIKLKPLSPAEEAVLRLQLDIGPDAKLVYLVHLDTYMARRHWPDYCVEVVGIDLNSLPGTVEGPIYPPCGREVHTYGHQLLMLRARIYWRDAPAYAEVRWRPGWREIQESIEREELARSLYELKMVRQGFELFTGHAPRGRSLKDLEPILEE